ncbi:MAG: hypothetical protein U1E36_00840 [Rickettsiales bacterium]
MSTKIKTTISFLALSAVMLFPHLALAGESSLVKGDADLEAMFAEDALISDQDLSNERGAADTTFTAETLGVAVLNGIAANNNAAGSVTGSNSISRGAFDNSQGVSFVVQNSGNNSVINAAMVINLSIK